MDLVHYLMLKIIKYKTQHFWDSISACPQAKKMFKTNSVGPNKYSCSQSLDLEVKSLLCYKLSAKFYRIVLVQKL
jgi:hypothetical protein